MNLSQARNKIINDVINIEGGFVDDPQDSGGATMCGITEATAAKHGIDVRKITKDQIYTIYTRDYWDEVLLDQVWNLAPSVAAEMFDTGVNTGTSRAVSFLQRALNALNNRGKLYPDVKQDGKMGFNTLEALKAFIGHRGNKGVDTLVNMLETQQGNFYLELSEKRPKDEKFQYGWQAHRVGDVDASTAQGFFGEVDASNEFTVEDVKAGIAPGAAFFEQESGSYQPSRSKKADMPPEFYTWMREQKAKERQQEIFTQANNQAATQTTNKNTRSKKSGVWGLLSGLIEKVVPNGYGTYITSAAVVGASVASMFGYSVPFIEIPPEMSGGTALGGALAYFMRRAVK